MVIYSTIYIYNYIYIYIPSSACPSSATPHQALKASPSFREASFPRRTAGQLRHLQPATEPWAWYTLVISGSSTNKWWLPGEYTMNTSPKCMYKSAGLPACLIGRCCSCFCSWFVLVSVLGLYLFLCSLAARFCFVWIKVAPSSKNKCYK